MSNSFNDKLDKILLIYKDDIKAFEGLVPELDLRQDYNPDEVVRQAIKDIIEGIICQQKRDLVGTLKRLYPDCNGDISVSDDGGIAANGTIYDLIAQLTTNKSKEK